MRTPGVTGAAVTMGVFDGVHLGHQTLLRRTQELADHDALMSVAVTFDRNPLEVIRPDAAPLAIQSVADKVAELERWVDYVHVLEFDEEFAQQEPQEFLLEMERDPIAVRHIVVGENFRFGRAATGDVAWLTERGAERGFTVEGMSLVDRGGRTISSTAIRELVAAGDVVAAADLLGRPFGFTGRVVQGEQRGRTIGFPTANIELPARRLRPGIGVYAGHAVADGREFAAVTNVGRRPTFDGKGVTIEVHLLDADIELYERDLAVTFEHRLRDEQKFDGIDALTAQIAKDRDEARRLIS